MKNVQYISPNESETKIYLKYANKINHLLQHLEKTIILKSFKIIEII
jgi:hypothetical protein